EPAEDTEGPSEAPADPEEPVQDLEGPADKHPGQWTGFLDQGDSQGPLASWALRLDMGP
ncbi:UNVERIFIED_CONTAM: hypothetical protein K2H54_047282, partial [Gekko kuhli]